MINILISISYNPNSSKGFSFRAGRLYETFWNSQSSIKWVLVGIYPSNSVNFWRVPKVIICIGFHKKNFVTLYLDHITLLVHFHSF